MQVSAYLPEEGYFPWPEGMPLPADGDVVVTPTRVAYVNSIIFNVPDRHVTIRLEMR